MEGTHFMSLHSFRSFLSCIRSAQLVDCEAKRMLLNCERSKSRERIEIMRIASVFIEDLINTVLTFALAMRPDGNTIAFILILKNVLQPIAGALSRPLFVEMSPKCTLISSLHSICRFESSDVRFGVTAHSCLTML